MTVAYNQGRRAFELFQSSSKNPYTAMLAGNNTARSEWFNGYYDEWRWQKWGPNEGEKYEPLTPISNTK